MKISESLELEYAKHKDGIEELEFITRDRIKDFVAAELFIPIVQELYDKNIFTNWSGLENDAHIRIPLDGLSRENFIIAKRNCATNCNWRVQRPPYLESGQLDVAPNYSFEIYIDYEDGVTNVSDVIDKMLAEIRKLRYQDIQIAKSEYAKVSKLPRLTLDGLYQLSEEEVFDIASQQFKTMYAESFEELSEIYLEGDNPQYYYDEETDTYFKNKELILKSKQYREYEKSPEKRKEKAIEELNSIITESMTDEEKYRTIFEWMINNFDYAYSGLYYAYAEKENEKERENKLVKYFNLYCRKELSGGIATNWLNIESRKKFLDVSQEDITIPGEAKEYTKRIIDLLEQCEKCKAIEKGFNANDIDTVWKSGYGVCKNFANIYEFLCREFNLPCKYIEGSIDSGDYNVGHAWNAIMVNGKLKYVDISSAIHCIDGHDTEHKAQEFFGKTFEELKKTDGAKNRTISELYQQEITELINESSGWDFGDN